MKFYEVAVRLSVIAQTVVPSHCFLFPLTIWKFNNILIFDKCGSVRPVKQLNKSK